MPVRDREQLALEQARRWPVAFAVHYFFTLLGAYTLLSYLAATYLGWPDTTSVIRESGIALLAAVLFTMFMRWRGGRSSPGPSAA